MSNKYDHQQKVSYQFHTDVIRKNDNCCDNNETIKNTDCCKIAKDAVDMTKRKSILAKDYYTRLEDRRKSKKCDSCDVPKSYQSSRIDKLKYQHYKRLNFS